MKESDDVDGYSIKKKSRPDKADQTLSLNHWEMTMAKLNDG